MNCMQFVASILMDTNLSQEMNLQSLSKVFFHRSEWIRLKCFFKMAKRIISKFLYSFKILIHLYICKANIIHDCYICDTIYTLKSMFIEISQYFYFRCFVWKWSLPRKWGHGGLSSESRVLDWRWNGKCTTRSRKSYWTYSTFFGSWRTTTLWIEFMKFRNQCTLGVVK